MPKRLPGRNSSLGGYLPLYCKYVADCTKVLLHSIAIEPTLEAGMGRKVVPVKTKEGTQEIRARALGLAPRIRTALLLVDGA